MLFIFFFILINLILQGFTHASPYKEPNKHPNFGFSTRLIHRSSPESPFYSRNYTRENHIEDGITNTQARVKYFSQNRKEIDKSYVAAPISGWNMLMKYKMGTPPVTNHGVFDTGSSFTWVQCQPCLHCYKQGKSPVFNPNKSTSFQPVFCRDPRCELALGYSCRGNSSDDFCLYNATYGDSLISSRGVLATETVTLSAQNTTRTVVNVVFGCGHDNHDRRKSPGIVGLGNASVSLVRQMSVSVFSHYVIANSTHIGGVAFFGQQRMPMLADPALLGSNDAGVVSMLTTTTTPLLPSQHGVYYLNLTGISVDGSTLDLPEDTFWASGPESGGFIIDSGTTYTTLRAEAFDMMVSRIMGVMHRHVPDSTKHFELCYEDVGDAPEVVFRFSGLDYVICDANLWVRHKGLYCLAMVRLSDDQSDENVSILGFHQQRNVHVGFDLENNLLSLMYPQGCPPDAIDFFQP